MNVLINDKPIRASRQSALWCIQTIEQLWRNRGKSLPETERVEAEATFDKAIQKYLEIAAQSP